VETRYCSSETVLDTLNGFCKQGITWPRTKATADLETARRACPVVMSIAAGYWAEVLVELSVMEQRYRAVLEVEVV
jgi:hypothetical protein